MEHIITFIGSILSVLGIVIYGTWYVHDKLDALERRTSVLEMNNAIIDKTLTELKLTHERTENKMQDEIVRLQDKINTSLDRLEDKIEKIYIMLSTTRSHEIRP